MWIKVCANTSLEDATLAVEAGANAVGFVFAESPRRVTREQVREIAPRLPQTIEKYGVFVDVGFDEIVATVRECGLTGVQLHSTPDAGLPLQLREYFAGRPGRLGILRVLHYSDELAPQLETMRGDHAVDAVLIDSRTAKAVGGTGIRFDWQAASRSFFECAPHLRLIAAGGLRPENVREAICTLQPWGVDVASGVEERPGKKDPERVRAFVAAARLAFLESRKAAVSA
ncbi:phosphoribosylanthranilate isomerase [Acidipila rosea]|uniref:N-(5'-phosphoribosyl)anthranilate isomerase n=1 Tax=Acidipila rosea TaxID=768535 RepID=A0A4V2PUW3_9BACT|nr:phosphoribosylanthranilate isomerase [Acidipila rosea]TCK72021.1 phosphoribosylanthranilate isomerase [Acidipila rosea]